MIKILVIYESQGHLHMARDLNTQGVAHIQFYHRVAATEHDVFTLSGLTFDAIVGLEHVPPSLVPYLLSRVRSIAKVA